MTEPFPLLLEKIVFEELFSAQEPIQRLRDRVASPDPWLKDDHVWAYDSLYWVILDDKVEEVGEKPMAFIIVNNIYDQDVQLVIFR